MILSYMIYLYNIICVYVSVVLVKYLLIRESIKVMCPECDFNATDKCRLVEDSASDKFYISKSNLNHVDNVIYAHSVLVLF